MAIYVAKKTTELERLTNMEEVEAKILAIAAEADAEHRADVVIELDQGAYNLKRPMVLDAAEVPGLAYINLTLRPKDGMRPAIAGLVGISGRDFVQVEGNVYKYQFEADEDGKYPVFRDLYIGHTRVPLAVGEVFVHPFGFANRADKSDPENYKGLYIPYAEAERLAKAEGISPAEMTIRVEWECCTLRVKGVDLADTCEKDGVTYARVTFEEEYESFIRRTNPCLDIGGRECYFANHPIYLTPNTFSYDCKTGALYYCLPEGEDIVWTRFAYPILENLFIFRGMNNLTVENLTFTGTTSKYICENGYCSGQANNEQRVGRLKHAAIVTANVRNFTLRGCILSELGGNGLLMVDRSVKVRIYDNKFMNIGMTALSIGNPTTAWENPVNQNIDVEVVNNYFYRIGYDYPTAVAFYMGIVDGLRFMYNTMDRTAYSAVSVGWGWALVDYELGEKVNIRDAEIAYNKITNYMDVLRDGAAIYVLGANCTAEHGGQFNFMHDNYAERELYKDSSKRGYYMDGSSSNWEVWDNVTSGVHLPIFSQFHVSNQFTHHNYIHDIYTTEPIDQGNHAPWRDTILGECYYVAEGLEALLEAYPKARMIRDYAGCDLEI